MTQFGDRLEDAVLPVLLQVFGESLTFRHYLSTTAYTDTVLVGKAQLQIFSVYDDKANAKFTFVTSDLPSGYTRGDRVIWKGAAWVALDVQDRIGNYTECRCQQALEVS